MIACALLVMLIRKPIVQQCTEGSERGNITHTGTGQATRQTSFTIVGQLIFPEGGLMKFYL